MTASPRAEYMRSYRSSPGSEEYVERERERRRCATRARAALIDEHRAEYEALYEAELKRAGLWPLQQAGRKPS